MNRYLLLLITTAAAAQAQVTEAWVTKIGGPIAEANAVAADRFGYVYAGGAWQGTGTSGTDMYVVKLNTATGDTVWTRFYRSANFDKVNAITLDDSGNVIAVGQSNNQYTVLKYGTDGALRWVWRDVQHLSSGSTAVAVCTDDQGSVFVTGNANDLGSSYNVYTFMFSSQGDSLWGNDFVGPTSTPDIAYDIAVDQDHNIYITGMTGGDILAIKLYPTGDTAWVRKYNGPGNGSDVAYAAVVDNSGNVYVAGEATNGTYLDACLVSYSPVGALRFARIYNGPANRNDTFYGLAIDSTQNVIATGVAGMSSVLQAALTVKYTSSGDSTWVRTYRPATADVSQGWRIAVDPAGTIYVAGSSRTGFRDITTLAYNPSGTLAWYKFYSGSGNFDDDARDIAVGDSGKVFVAGTVPGTPGSADFAVICYKPIGTAVDMAEGRIPETFELSQNYPNPFNPATTIRFTIGGVAALSGAFSSGVEGPAADKVRLVVYDILGREVAMLVNQRRPAGSYEVRFDASNLATGVYFLRLTAENFVQTRKMILLQ